MRQRRPQSLPRPLQPSRVEALSLKGCRAGHPFDLYNDLSQLAVHALRVRFGLPS